MTLLLKLAGVACLLFALGYGFYLFFYERPPKISQNPSRRTASDWGRIADQIEGYASGHAARVAAYARMLAEAAGLSQISIDSLKEAGHLHDVGMIDWRRDLVLRQGPLETTERMLLSEHAARGQRMALKAGDVPWSHLWVRWHHERFDGTGYPDGLWGEDIPIEARILAIADSFDAMCHHRPYRSAMDYEEAITELQRLSGIQYDPRLVQLFAECVARTGPMIDY